VKTKKTKPAVTTGLRQILVPVDFSKASLDALQHTLALAQRHDAQLTLLHVLKPLAWSKV